MVSDFFFHMRKLNNTMDPSVAVATCVVFHQSDWFRLEKTDNYFVFFYMFPKRMHKIMLTAYTLLTCLIEIVYHLNKHHYA